MQRFTQQMSEFLKSNRPGEAVVGKKNFYIDYFLYLAWIRTKNTDVWFMTFTLTTFKTFNMQRDLCLKLDWELGFGQNLGWEMGSGTPLQDP